MRLVKVTLWQLTDQELDDLAAAADATDTARANALRHLKKWRRDHASPAVTNATACSWCCDDLVRNGSWNRPCATQVRVPNGYGYLPVIPFQRVFRAA